MNLATFERAQLAAFAYREARYTGSIDCMKAICYVQRNRRVAGWGDGSWLSVLGMASHAQGNFRTNSEDREPFLEASDRLLQLIIRDVDDIYLGQDRMDDATRLVVCGDNPPKTSALYYTFVDQTPRPWFIENIVRQPVEHPRMGNVGPIMLFR